MEDLGQPDETRKRIVLLEMEARLQRLALNAEPYQPAPQRGLGTLSREASGAEKVARIAYYIAQNYTERLTVERIAQYVELHPNYAMELFRRTLA
jgi:AraC-like DNA-binding protein